MAEPITIKAEPATTQVRTVAMSSAPPGEHVLVIGQDESRGTTEFHAACSCGRWSASHHPDRSVLEQTHAKHVAKKKEAANG